MTGDLSCEKFRHVSATEEQIGIIRPFVAQLKSWLQQIAANNDAYDEHCARPASDPRGKGK